jgi:hypothetical protein
MKFGDFYSTHSTLWAALGAERRVFYLVNAAESHSFQSLTYCLLLPWITPLLASQNEVLTCCHWWGLNPATFSKLNTPL